MGSSDSPGLPYVFSVSVCPYKIVRVLSMSKHVCVCVPIERVEWSGVEWSGVEWSEWSEWSE